MATVYEIITDKIIAQLEAGYIPWLKPWKPADAPHNIRGTRYTGINTYLLEFERQDKNYTSNVWMTFNQVKEYGGDVTGQKTTMVIYAATFGLKNPDGSAKVNSKGKQESGFSIRYYNVFNADQVKGLALPAQTTQVTLDPIAAADQVVNQMPDKPSIKHGGDRAFYSPTLDYVQMPPRDSFNTPELYYTTLFHELGHSTGHENRLDRFSKTHDHSFGSQDYSKEELTAEMTAAFIMGETGIETPTTERNTTAYIQNWISALENDKNMLVSAASAAQKAADFILDRHAPAPTAE